MKKASAALSWLLTGAAGAFEALALLVLRAELEEGKGPAEEPAALVALAEAAALALSGAAALPLGLAVARGLTSELLAGEAVGNTVVLGKLLEGEKVCDAATLVVEERVVVEEREGETDWAGLEEKVGVAPRENEAELLSVGSVVAVG